jgi:serine/threonine-protein kinase
MAVPAENRAARGPVKVVGRYALYGELAAGGMATVHIGRLLGPVGFARTVAIKRLHPQFAKDPEFVSMFLDEARLAARVQHPNVVATIDVVATDGELFLIMDYVRGESLAKLVRATVKQDGWVPPRVVSSIMCGFLHGLHSAHEAKNERGEPLNLIHRDVSPQNVLVGADGVSRVLDFGVAKAAGRIQVTREGQVKGKLAYMPPEQLSGSTNLTRAVDIYASAVVLWETLCGERLFRGESEGETLHKILKAPVPPPSSRVNGLNRKFDEVCLRALDRDPSKRYTTARQMALALEACEGIASPTEVGEWVEAVAGSTLNDREERIAEIESDSAGLALSPAGHMSGPGIPVPSPSDSDFSRPAVPLSGPHSAPQIIPAAPHSARGGAPPISNREPPPNSDISLRRTGIVRSRTPLVVAIVVVLLLLCVFIGIGVFGRKSPTDEGAAAASASASALSSSASAPASPSSPVASSGSAADPAESAVPPGTSGVASSAPSASSPPSQPPQQPQTGAKAPPWRPPVHTADPPPPPPPTGKKPPNCDPPFTIDSKGHKHYKIECN